MLYYYAHTHARETRARARAYRNIRKYILKYRHAGTSMFLLNKHTLNINFLTRSARWLRR